MKENNLDHVFLVSDRGLEAIGVVKKIQDIISEAGLECTTYLDVEANSYRCHRGGCDRPLQRVRSVRVS